MTILYGLSLASIVLGLIPLILILRNRSLFLPPPRLVDPSATGRPQVSLLIPARNEAEGIASTLHAALASTDVILEVVVLDDASTDATGDIVAAIAQRDSRVRLVRGQPLPPGWNGKQFACFQLAAAAQHEHLMFIDADVRLSADAVARLCAQRAASELPLLSAFPYQQTETFWEKLLIPMMHFILLGFLPIDRMRRDRSPALAAGCGQLFLTTKTDYQLAGTHQAIRSSRHDGLKLPRAYRSAGLMTDICDGTPLCSCRMYTSARGVFSGLLKNAAEGIASPRLIFPFSILFIGGGVLPLILAPLIIRDFLQSSDTLLLATGGLAIVISFLPRLICMAQFAQSRLGALLHPLALLVFVVLQWWALCNHLRGRQVAWRGRSDS